MAVELKYTSKDCVGVPGAGELVWIAPGAILCEENLFV